MRECRDEFNLLTTAEKYDGELCITTIHYPTGFFPQEHSLPVSKQVWELIAQEMGWRTTQPESITQTKNEHG